MSSSESRNELILKMDQRELDTIAQAAKLEGLDLSSWVRQTLLDAASSRIERASRQQTPTQFDPTDPTIGLTAGPRICWCGNTRDPRGECDG